MSGRSSPPRLRTLGVIAQEVRAPLHRIRYVLTTRPHIQPVARAGNARLFDKQALAMIRHELNAIDARRANREVSDD